jgi:hypothetical protein
MSKKIGGTALVTGLALFIFSHMLELFNKTLGVGRPPVEASHVVLAYAVAVVATLGFALFWAGVLFLLFAKLFGKLFGKPEK